MTIRERIEAHAAAHPYPALSYYAIWQDSEKSQRYSHWRVSHCIMGTKVPLLRPIFTGRDKRGKERWLTTLTPLAMDLCGGIRFTTRQGYWLDIDAIDFEKLERKQNG